MMGGGRRVAEKLGGKVLHHLCARVCRDEISSDHGGKYPNIQCKWRVVTEGRRHLAVAQSDNSYLLRNGRQPK